MTRKITLIQQLMHPTVEPTVSSEAAVEQTEAALQPAEPVEETVVAAAVSVESDAEENLGQHIQQQANEQAPVAPIETAEVINESDETAAPPPAIDWSEIQPTTPAVFEPTPHTESFADENVNAYIAEMKAAEEQAVASSADESQDTVSTVETPIVGPVIDAPTETSQETQQMDEVAEADRVTEAAEVIVDAPATPVVEETALAEDDPYVVGVDIEDNDEIFEIMAVESLRGVYSAEGDPKDLKSGKAVKFSHGHGKIAKIFTAPFFLDKKHHKASKDTPIYLVRHDKGGKHSLHKASALTLR